MTAVAGRGADADGPLLSGRCGLFRCLRRRLFDSTFFLGGGFSTPSRWLLSPPPTVSLWRRRLRPAQLCPVSAFSWEPLPGLTVQSLPWKLPVVFVGRHRCVSWRRSSSGASVWMGSGVAADSAGPPGSMARSCAIFPSMRVFCNRRSLLPDPRGPRLGTGRPGK